MTFTKSDGQPKKAGMSRLFYPVCAAVVSSLIIAGCQGGKSGSKETIKAAPDNHVAVQASADAVARAKAKAAKSGSSPCGTSDLFNKMDSMIYHGDMDKYGDVVLSERSLANNMDPVVFSHRIHRAKYTCRACHLELEFSMKKGESGITREDYLDGRYCGACHNGKTAFSVDKKEECSKCHVPVDGDGNYASKNRVSVPEEVKQEFGDGVDWVKLLGTGAIAPVTSLTGEENSSTMPLPEHLKDDKLRWTTKTPSYPVSVAVWFPHDVHVKWLDCANCHPDIFTVKQNGTVDFDKTHILKGKYCGACHLKVAFPMDGCRRCHPTREDKK